MRPRILLSYCFYYLGDWLTYTYFFRYEKGYQAYQWLMAKSTELQGDSWKGPWRWK